MMSVADMTLGFVPGTNADFLSPTAESVSVSPPQDSAIAPWTITENEEPVSLVCRFGIKLMMVQPTPPPKPNQRFLPNKSSFSSFSTNRTGNTVNSPYQNQRSRPSETFSFDSNDSSSYYGGDRKHKTSLLSNLINKKLSKGKLRDDASFQGSTSQPPPLPTNPSFLPISSPRRDKLKGKKKPRPTNGTTSSLGPYASSSSHSEPVFTLDTDLDSMEGIVDTSHQRMDTNSISSGVESALSDFNSFGSPPTFLDPFRPGATVSKRSARPPRKISPNTTLPDLDMTTKLAVEDGPSWTAPESWAVEKEGEDKEEPEYYSSEEDVATAAGHSSSNRISKHKSHGKRPAIPRSINKPALMMKPFKMRVYRADNTYHVVSIGLSVTVAELTLQLLKRLLDPERETHRLYLKERGRERLLAQTERPADIVRRRLEQAGYTIADGLDMLGTEDLRFLMTFVYKSNLLGSAVSLIYTVGSFSNRVSFRQKISCLMTLSMST